MVFSMDLGFLLAFFVLFLLLPPLLGQQYSSSTCPKDFNCHKLGPLGFPFSNYTQSHCGLCHLDCTDSPPRINLKLNPWSEEWSEVQGMAKNDAIKLHDLSFSALLQTESCGSFTYDLQHLNSASISFTTRNVTLFKCSKKIPLSRQEEIADHFRGYRNESCPDFDIYYTVPKHSGSQIPPDPFPSDCSPIQLPMRPMEAVSNIDSHLFDLLTAVYDLQWQVSHECTECHNGGGQCQSYEINQFHCAAGKKNLKVIIGSSVAGGALLMVLAIILILYKKVKGINFRPRNSSEPSSKIDLEGGSAIYFGLPVFSYGELEEVTNNFDVSKELGSGGFGVVYHGKLHDGREVAVKRLYEHNFKRMTQFFNEVEILTRLRHPNLVSLYGCTSRRSRELLLVYEYIPNGTVADHLHGNRAKDQSLTWPVRMNIAIETAGALAYLHASDIIHRDVKTNNILLGHNFQVKVADFGLSRLFPNDVSHISTAPQGTPGYVDPVYHQCYQLTDKSDVYSFGVVLIELISSMPAVDISRNRHEINLASLATNRIQRHAFNELIDPSLGYESDPEVLRMTISVAELAFQCLQLEKEMRPTMDEVLDSLKAIQDCNEDFIEMTKVTRESTDECRGRMVHPSAKLDGVVLLKNNIKFLSSPLPETGLLVRGSTNTS